MKLIIDTDRRILIHEDGQETRQYALYSREAFELISQEWLRVGWEK